MDWRFCFYFFVPLLPILRNDMPHDDCFCWIARKPGDIIDRRANGFQRRCADANEEMRGDAIRERPECQLGIFAAQHRSILNLSSRMLTGERSYAPRFRGSGRTINQLDGRSVVSLNAFKGLHRQRIVFMGRDVQEARGDSMFDEYLSVSSSYTLLRLPQDKR